MTLLAARTRPRSKGQVQKLEGGERRGRMRRRRRGEGRERERDVY